MSGMSRFGQQEQQPAAKRCLGQCGRMVDPFRMPSGQWLAPGYCPDCMEAGAERQARAERSERIQALWAKSELPPAARGTSLATLDGRRYRDRQGRAWDLVQAWNYSPGSWRAPWFFGPRGLGKSTLAWCLARRVICEMEKPVLYLGVADMLRRQREGYLSHATCEALIEKAIGSWFLVLDDFGGQNMTTWVLESLFVLVNERLNHRRPTLVISNYGPTQIAAMLTPTRNPEYQPTAEALADRLLELCDPCQLQGESIRLEQALERQGS